MTRRLKRRLLRGAGYFTIGLAGAFALFWWWQPWEYDLIPKTPSEPVPVLEPDSERLFQPGTKVMVVTAHPDDEAFYIGGTLTQLKESGAEIAFVLCTDGDKAYYGPFTDSKENREIRRKEVQELGAVLGTQDIVFLGFPDGRLRNSERLREKIKAEIERFKPDYLMTFDDKYPRRFSHSDHRRTGEAAVQAAEETGLPMWMLLFQSNTPTFRIDISQDWEAKRKLLAIHRSQFYGEGLERIEGLVRGTAEREGAAMGVALAEGFRVLRYD